MEFWKFIFWSIVECIAGNMSGVIFFFFFFFKLRILLENAINSDSDSD